MEDETLERSNKSSSGDVAAVVSTEPAVRSRWTPKPEQILILESIFNSGMVNPPKEETVRIRKLLEKFGAVGDANVFYWFQNRRSRSRRRQRQQQMQAILHHQIQPPPPPPSLDQSSSSSFYPIPNNHQSPLSLDHYHHHHHHHHHMPSFLQSSEYISVVINGVPTDVPNGAIEVKSMFGDDVVLVHSSGLPLPINEYGILMQTLHPGESYYLVPRPTL